MILTKNFAWRASLAVLALTVAATTANADTQVIKRKKTFFQSLFGGSSGKPRKVQRAGLFDSKPWWNNDNGDVRIISDPAASRRNQLLADSSDPEGSSGYGMGNLTYVPGKLVQLGGTVPKEPRPAGTLEAAVYDALSSADLGIRVTAGERDAILAHYGQSGFKPLWIANGKVSDRARTVLKVLADAAAEGMDPESYLPPVLTGYAAAETLSGSDSGALARLDLGLTAMALKYARQASGGEFDPRKLSRYNDVTPEIVNPEVAMKVIAWSPYADSYLRDLQPKLPAYAAMKAALAELRKDGPGSAPVVVAGGPRLKPGSTDDRIPDLRARLGQLGYDMPADDAAGDPLLFDATLSGVLKKFQKSAGLKASGSLDAATVNALNGHGSERDRQRLVDNMERLRWLPKSLGNRYVFVNQAAFKVQVIDSGKEIWNSRVIVGKPTTQTAVFDDEIETVVFNPSWGVPPSIIANEYLPKLRRDPGYLDRIGFKVVNSRGKQVSSGGVDWWSYGSKVPFSIQQPPGNKNALGELKFLFPNSHNIYMHDTPSRELFANDVRAFSHGCVRVQNPREFATVLLGWDRARIDKTTDSKASQSVALKSKVPVHITYFTAWPDETGKIQYFNDIYGRDQAMEDARQVLTVAGR